MAQQPLYRGRVSQKDIEVQDYEFAAMYHRVFGTPEGLKVLDDICLRLCGVDAVIRVHNPYELSDHNARRNVGITIATLALGEFGQAKPKVQTEPEKG